MIRRTVLMSVIALFVLSSQASAADTYQQWIKLFEGTWKIQVEGAPHGEMKVECLKGNHAAVVRRTMDGTTGVDLIGWRADEEVLVDTMHSDDGTYSVVTYDQITEQEMRGKITKSTGTLADFVGDEVVVTKKDNDTVVAVIKGEDGSDLLTAQYKRFDPVRSPIRAPKAAAEVID